MRLITCAMTLFAAAVATSAQDPRIIREPIAVLGATKKNDPSHTILRASLSHDGKFVALARTEGTVAVFDIDKDQELFATPAVSNGNASPFCSPAFSSDGNWLAYAASRGRVEIVAARTGKPRASIDLPRPPIEGVDSLAFSPDAKMLAVSSGVLYHKDLRVFDAATAKLLGQPLSDVDGIAYQLVFSPDGKRLLVNHWSDLFLIDCDAMKLKAKWKARTFAVYFHEGRMFAVDDDLAAIREVADDGIGKTSVGKLAEKSDTQVAMRSVIAGKPLIAAVTVGNAVSIRDLQGKESIRVEGEDSAIRKLVLSADGQVLMIDRHPTRVEVFKLN